jgi:hypothetical protein
MTDCYAGNIEVEGQGKCSCSQGKAKTTGDTLNIPHGDGNTYTFYEYECCESGGDGENCGDYDEAVLVGIAAGLIAAIVVPIVLIVVGIVLCCFFCTSCPVYKSRMAKKNAAAAAAPASATSATSATEGVEVEVKA